MKKLSLFFAMFLAWSSFSNISAQAIWRIHSQTGGVFSDSPSYLQVIENESYLTYQKRPSGINLGWGKSSKPNIQFVKAGMGVIKCGDRIALYVTGGGYVKYEKRPTGINLVWSKEPVYEWELRSVDNVKGGSLSIDAVGLYNATANDFVVYCNRKNMPVVNLAWLGDCLDGVRLPGIINDLRKDYGKYKDMIVSFKKKLGR